MDREIIIRMTTATLPGDINGCCVMKDGKYIMIVNDAKSTDEQAAAAAHEFLHIWHDDFDYGSADEVERLRH